MIGFAGARLWHEPGHTLHLANLAVETLDDCPGRNLPLRFGHHRSSMDLFCNRDAFL
jgi:hypothetical protein